MITYKRLLSHAQRLGTPGIFTACIYVSRRPKDALDSLCSCEM